MSINVEIKGNKAAADDLNSDNKKKILLDKRFGGVRQFQMLSNAVIYPILAGYVPDCPPPIKDMAKQRNNSAVSLADVGTMTSPQEQTYPRSPPAAFLHKHIPHTVPLKLCYWLITDRQRQKPQILLF